MTAHPASLGLEGEARVLAHAQAELAAGNSREALVLLTEHDQLFPAGALAPESGALRLEALCASGLVQEARTAAIGLKERFPSALAFARPQSPCVEPR
jgi:hypothetical protein